MMVAWMRVLGAAAVLAVAGCGSTDDSPGDGLGAAGPGGQGGSTVHTGGHGAGGSAGSGNGGGAGGQGGSPVDCDHKSDACASQFGSLFTASDGRADGTLRALLQTTDSQCAMSNNDHVVLELTMLGQVQRLVASVDGVAVTTASAPLVGPAYAEGWHTNVLLEYTTDLGVHSTDFTSVTMAEAEAFLCEHLNVGDPVSVYAYSDGSDPSSAHQIHWNASYSDGAIAAQPTSGSPLYLLFRYADDVF